MKKNNDYRGFRFPPEIIGYAVWLYHRFTLSFRDIEELPAERGFAVSYEAVRLWCIRFGPDYARRLRKKQHRFGDYWYLDEISTVTIHGTRMYLWRAVDQDGDLIDVLVQRRKDKRAAKRLFRKMLKHQMRCFKSMKQAQRFLSVHGAVNNLFRLGRHLLRACHYRMFRTKAFSEWQQVTCAYST